MDSMWIESRISLPIWESKIVSFGIWSFAAIGWSLSHQCLYFPSSSCPMYPTAYLRVLFVRHSRGIFKHLGVLAVGFSLIVYGRESSVLVTRKQRYGCNTMKLKSQGFLGERWKSELRPSWLRLSPLRVYIYIYCWISPISLPPPF